MTNSILLALLLQLVVSTKAGLVNHAQGKTNLTALEQIRKGSPIRTGENGYAEVLLTPGSFLRLDENSEAVLDNVDLSNVVLRVVSGAAVIEVIEIDKNYPLRIITGNLTTEIAASGIYRYADGVATVIEGKLRTGDSKFTYAKGWQVFFKDNYRAKKVTGVLLPTGLDVYSKSRSSIIASANASAPSTLSVPVGYTYNYWVFSPAYGWYTFIPRSDLFSPYGYRYHRYATAVVRNNPGSYGGPTSNPQPGGSTTTPNAPSTPTTSPGDGGGGGTAAPTATPVSSPAGQQTTVPAYIEGKNAPVSTTAP